MQFINSLIILIYEGNLFPHKFLTSVICSIFFLAIVSCAKINTKIGVTHERLELGYKKKNIDNNALKTLNIYLNKNEKIDSTKDSCKYYLFYIFSYGCSFNKKHLNRIDTLLSYNKDIKPIFVCDNLDFSKKSILKLYTLDSSIIKFLIYPKVGVKKSLHAIGENYGFKSTLETYPNRFYFINASGKVLYASYSPTWNHIDSISSIINSNLSKDRF